MPVVAKMDMEVLVFDANTVSLSAQMKWGTLMNVVQLAGKAMSQRHSHGLSVGDGKKAPNSFLFFCRRALLCWRALGRTAWARNIQPVWQLETSQHCLVARR